MNNFPLLSFCFLYYLTFAVNATITTVAEIGMPAAGYESHYVYKTIDGGPAIGNGGHIAFTGIATNSLDDTDISQFHRVLWFGKPHQISIKAKVGQLVNGSLEQMTIEDIKSNSISSHLVISDLGSVAFKASVTVGNNYYQAILIATDEIISSAVVEGLSHAPGFPEGITINSVGHYLYTDAGMAIWGQTSSNKTAIWLWKDNSLQLVISEEHEISGVYPNCFLSSVRNRSSVILNDFNKKGGILFYAEFTQKNIETSCPIWALFTWESGVIKKIAAESDTPPVVNLSYSIGVYELDGPTLNDNGDVSFSQFGTDWFARKGEAPVPVLFYRESVPTFPEYSSSSARSQQNHLATNINDISIVKARWIFDDVLLVGEAKKDFIYPETVFDLGATHLKLLYSDEMHPPGLGADWTFSKISDSIGINNLNTIIFEARLINDRDFKNSLWRTDLEGDLQLLIAEDHPVIIDNKDSILSSFFIRIKADNISGDINSTNGGFSKQFNDLNQIIFLGAKSNFFNAIFLYEENDCVGTYQASGLLKIPCVTLENDPNNLTYQVDLQLVPSSNPISFIVSSIQQQREDISNASCIATYLEGGQLNLPCVSVSDAQENTVMFMATMKLTSSSGSFIFKLIQAFQK